MSSSPSCPVCGDALAGIGPQARSARCPSCGSWVVVGDSGWVAGGEFTRALDAPAFLHVGREGRLGGERVTAAGRVRLAYEGGEWDEWWLLGEDGAGHWLEEDDGRYLLHVPVDVAPGGAGTAHVGGTLEAGGRRWLVVESLEARVLGAEGELPVAVPAGAAVRCVDAVGGGERLSLELWGDEVLASAARPADEAGLVWAP